MFLGISYIRTPVQASTCVRRKGRLSLFLSRLAEHSQILSSCELRLGIKHPVLLRTKAFIGLNTRQPMKFKKRLHADKMAFSVATAYPVRTSSSFQIDTVSRWIRLSSPARTDRASEMLQESLDILMLHLTRIQRNSHYVGSLGMMKHAAIPPFRRSGRVQAQ